MSGTQPGDAHWKQIADDPPRSLGVLLDPLGFSPLSHVQREPSVGTMESDAGVFLRATPEGLIPPLCVFLSLLLTVS